ncbi:chemotaxis protein CheA [Mucilaginibacter robiniae]|uniref:Chemotaxis protein CheA n=1 Tax=Mucilaginibacter robiniae TaxID=2728022 RepID=A0A7L5DZX4_9SPHI|nr:chemotaxis protein CheA [Mucilaginibacter robiniae]QJD96535.1 chemotaxis protein CheA [Mucilaginibacter robiniae]
MDSYKDNFTDESLELITELEKCLLLLEGSPTDKTLIEQVFRAMHTIKGNSSMFGYQVIADFTHHLETIYEYIRSGKQQVTKEVLDITLTATDHLSWMVQHAEDEGLSTNEKHQALLQTIAAVASKAEGVEPSVETNTFIINFQPHQDYFYNGANPLVILHELATLGECQVQNNLTQLPALENLDPTRCYTSWQITLTTKASIEEIKQPFVFVEGRCALKIELQAKPIQTDIVSSQPTITSLSSAELLSKKVISSIRVPSEKVDTLMSLVSELITLQAKLGVLAEQNPYAELIGVSENLEKILTRLRDNAFSISLVPLKTIITPFNRLVRDLAAQLNKEIKFITEGTETELDKNIMEGLSDPLMHVLRNSIDHGIEDAVTRQKLGKNPCGTILLKAYCASNHVFIEVQDDGKGLDTEKIRNKAIQRGLISSDDYLTQNEVLNLIFLPGFSTAEQISQISGRGVGMDVVKRSIEDVRGRIKVTSVINQGTTITIKLPITISIIDGLLIKVNQTSYVIPLSSVDRCYEAPAVRQLNRFNNIMILDGQQIPFISLSEEFENYSNYSDTSEIVLVYVEEKRVAFIVDQVLGKFQAVLKPLGKHFQGMENISGATILGDGSIALVLDPNKVAEQYLQNKKAALC